MGDEGRRGGCVRCGKVVGVCMLGGGRTEPEGGGRGMGSDRSEVGVNKCEVGRGQLRLED